MNPEAPSLAVLENNKAFAVEQNGINLISDLERNGSPKDLAWVWAGANIILTYVITGSLMASLGLTLSQMLIVVILGNLLFVLVGYGGVPGARVGTATMAISRASFGRRGNIIPSVLSWLTIIGWEAVNIVLGAFAVFAFFGLIGMPLGALGKVVVLTVLVGITFGVAVLGHATINVLQRFFTWTLGILMLGLIPQIYQLPLPANFVAPTGASFASLCIAFTIVAALPVSYATYSADFTRYLPRSTSGKAITFWTFIGSFLPAVIITVIGYFAARVGNLSDPIGGFQPLLVNWYFGLFLIAVIGGSITNNFLNTYSSGMSLLAMDLKVTRPVAILIDAVLATAASAYAIFYYDFTSTFVAFLSLLVAWVAPWWAIYLVDAVLRRAMYKGTDLLSATGGAYQYSGGWHGAGYIAWICGIIAAVACTSAPAFTSPFAAVVLGGADLSIIAGMVVAGAIYWLLARSLPSAAARGQTP
jgi:nucleobase:cation symporter-1, NCS1 family